MADTYPTVRAIHVPDVGDVEVIDIVPEFKFIGKILGGWLECVTLDNDVHAYCDEEGKIKGIRPNIRATVLAVALGWRSDDVLCGPVVFLGGTPDGEEADVPAQAIATAAELGIIL